MSVCLGLLFVASLVTSGQVEARVFDSKKRPETLMSHDGFYAEFGPALAKARSSRLDLLIDFGGSDWCEPCWLLKEHVMKKPEFFKKAQRQFVCVDIDDLYRGVSPARKKRYAAVEKQFNIHSFPSVILATPDGLAYGWATYAENADSPSTFWARIYPLIERGKAFRLGLARADRLTGLAKAQAMVAGMSQIRADLLWHFHSGKIAELRKLDPTDQSGFLAYLDARRETEQLENSLGKDYDLNRSIRISDVEKLVSKYKMKGELAQQAELMEAVIYTSTLNQPLKALGCFKKLLDEQDRRTTYDRGDYVPLTSASISVIRKRLREAGPDLQSQYLSLHRIFELDLPDRYELSCHGGDSGTFRPNIVVRLALDEAYGGELLKSTASLDGNERAKALAAGLRDTRLLRTPNVGKVVGLIGQLVGKEEGAAILPEWYKPWLGAVPARGG